MPMKLLFVMMMLRLAQEPAGRQAAAPLKAGCLPIAR